MMMKKMKKKSLISSIIALKGWLQVLLMTFFRPPHDDDMPAGIEKKLKEEINEDSSYAEDVDYRKENSLEAGSPSNITKDGAVNFARFKIFNDLASMVMILAVDGDALYERNVETSDGNKFLLMIKSAIK